MSFDEDNSLIQKLMNQSYERWQQNKTWTQKGFWSQLSPIEKVAVYCGNLNYQVCNGGFMQWHYWNNYSDCWDELNDILERIGTETVLKVRELANKYLGDCEDFEDSHEDCDEYSMSSKPEGYCDICGIDFREEYPEDYDSQFYEINGRFLEEVEEYLQKQSVVV